MLYSSASKDFWGDEVIGIHAAKQESIKLLVQNMLKFTHQPHPPLYNILLHYWISVFGESEVFIRLLSIVFGVLSIVVIFHLGKLIVNRDFGIVLALISAFSPFLIFFSSMARWYSLSLLLSVLSYYYYLLLVRDDRNIKNWILYTLSSILLFYTHFLTYSIVVVQNTFLFFYHRKNIDLLKRWIVCQLVVLLFSTFPLIQLLSQFMTLVSGHSELVDLGNSFLAYPVMLIYALISFSIGETILPWNFWVTIPTFFLFMALILIGTRTLFYRERVVALLWFLYIGFSFVLGMIAIDMADLPIFMISSHLIFITPLYYFVIAMGIYNAKSIKNRGVLLIGLLLIFAYSTKNLISNQEFHNPNYVIPWKQIVQDISSMVQERDLIISIDEVAFDYYAQKYIDKAIFLYSDLDMKSYAIYDPEENIRMPVKSGKDVYEDLIRNSSAYLWLILRDRGARQSVQSAHNAQNVIEKTHFLVSISQYVREDLRTVSFKQKLLTREVPSYKVSIRKYQRKVVPN
jgi:hypothetical protein